MVIRLALRVCVVKFSLLEQTLLRGAEWRAQLSYLRREMRHDACILHKGADGYKLV